MTDEDDEFARIERENAMKGQPYHFTKRKDDDDDIQEYVRPWKGMTEDEVFALSNTMPYADRFEFAKAIEAKLKEKNT
jgi:hypothetical protein